jgi:ATP-binding cassette subfamily B protein
MSRHIEFDLKTKFSNMKIYLKIFTNKIVLEIWWTALAKMFQSRMYVGPAVYVHHNTVIRFAIVIVYMYNVSPLTFIRCYLYPFYLYNFLSSEINVRVLFFSNIYLKYLVFTRNIFRNPSNKGYSLEDQHQNNMVKFGQWKQK